MQRFGKTKMPGLTEQDLQQINETSTQWHYDILPLNKHVSIDNSMDLTQKWEQIKMAYDYNLRKAQNSKEQWDIRKVQLYWLHGMLKQVLLLDSTLQANERFNRQISQIIILPDGKSIAGFPYSPLFKSSSEDVTMQAIGQLLVCFDSKIDALGTLLKDINYKPRSTELTAQGRREINRAFKRLFTDLIENSPNTEMQKNHQRYILDIFSSHTRRKYEDNDTAFIISGERVELLGDDFRDQMTGYVVLWQNIDHFQVLMNYLANLHLAGQILSEQIQQSTIPGYILQSIIELIAIMTTNGACEEKAYDNLIWKACLLTKRTILPWHREGGYAIDAEVLITNMLQNIKRYAEIEINYGRTRGAEPPRPRTENYFDKRYFGKHYFK